MNDLFNDMIMSTFLGFGNGSKSIVDVVGIIMGSFLGTFMFVKKEGISKASLFSSVVSGCYGADLGSALLDEILPGMYVPHPVLGAICISSLFPVIISRVRKLFDDESKGSDNTK